MRTDVDDTKTTLLRPDHGYNFIEVPTEILDRALNEIKTRSICFIAGIDEPTATDMLMYKWLKDCGVL